MNLQQFCDNRHSSSGLILRICGQCGEEFKATRSDAVYCSPRCRLRAWRGNSRFIPSSSNNETPNPISPGHGVSSSNHSASANSELVVDVVDVVDVVKKENQTGVFTIEKNQDDGVFTIGRCTAHGFTPEIGQGMEILVMKSCKDCKKARRRMLDRKRKQKKKEQQQHNSLAPPKAEQNLSAGAKNKVPPKTKNSYSLHTGLNHLSKPPVNFDQPLPDEQMESQVTDLVKAFCDFKRTKIPEEEDSIQELDDHLDFLLRAWHKTFRIMLHKDDRSFEDIQSVITSLRPFQDYIDINRYSAPIHLREEFDELFEFVMMLRSAQPDRVEKYRLAQEQSHSFWPDFDEDGEFYDPYQDVTS